MIEEQYEIHIPGKFVPVCKQYELLFSLITQYNFLVLCCCYKGPRDAIVTVTV